MEIKKLNRNEVSDFRSLVEIFKSAFESEEQIPDNQLLGKLLSNPNFLVFVVMQSNEVVAGLTIYTLETYFGSKPVAFIYDVAVKPEFQGRGFGTFLITEVCKYCEENGFADAFVEALSDDIDAIKFYRKTKFSKQLNVIQFNYTFGNTI